MLQRAVAALVVGGAALLLPAVPAARAAATVTVDVTTDTYDGSCADGDCSLRDGIATAGSGGTVLLPPGFYPLTAVEAGGGAGDGSIEIAGVLRIRGIGETGAFIDGSALGAPVFETRSGDALTLRDVTLFGATTDVGGPAVWVRGGLVRLRAVTVTGGRGVRAGAVQMSSFRVPARHRFAVPRQPFARGGRRGLDRARRRRDHGPVLVVRRQRGRAGRGDQRADRRAHQQPRWPTTSRARAAARSGRSSGSACGT